MRAHDAQACDMPVLHAVRWLLLHLRQHVPHDLGVLGGEIGGAAGAGGFGVAGARAHDGDEAQLRPGQRMV